MKNHVARLLKKPVRVRKMMSVTLDGEQIELVEKLSLFFTRETKHTVSKNQVVEEAVKAFVDDSAQYIAEEFDLDIREVTLTEMQQYKSVCTVGVGVLDTVVLPIREEEQSRVQLFDDHCWASVQLDQEKLSGMKFAAFYFCNPTCAVTHYARITAVTSVEDDPKRRLLHFDQLEELGQPLEWSEHQAQSLRRPRYTVFSLLMEAKSLEELF